MPSFHPIHSQISEAVQDWIDRNNSSQRKLARSMQVDQAAISHRLKSQCRWMVEDLRPLHEAGVSIPEDICFGNVDPEGDTIKIFPRKTGVNVEIHREGEVIGYRSLTYSNAEKLAHALLATVAPHEPNSDARNSRGC